MLRGIRAPHIPFQLAQRAESQCPRINAPALLKAPTVCEAEHQQLRRADLHRHIGAIQAEGH
eukprot:8386070-Prorocentrum_lima.AAC.1